MDVVSRLLISIALCLCIVYQCKGASGENEFTPYVNARVTYDDNLYKIDESLLTGNAILGDIALSDTIQTLGAGLNVDWWLSNQQIVARLYAADNTFANNSQFDNRQSSIETAWNWNINNVVSGTLKHQQTKQLASFVDNLEAALLAAITENSRSQFDMGFNIHARLKVTLLASEQKTKNGAEEISRNDRDITLIKGSLTYGTMASNSFVATISRQKIRYINRIFNEGDNVDNAYELSSISLTTNYKLGDKSRVSARVTWDNLEPQNLESNSEWDIADWGFTISHRWMPSSKISVETSLVDEISPSEDITANFQRSKKADMKISWQALNKTHLTLGFAHEKRELELNVDNLIFSNRAAEDTFTSANLGVVYQASDNFEIHVGHNFSGRRSAAVGRDFDSNASFAAITAKW